MPGWPWTDALPPEARRPPEDPAGPIVYLITRTETRTTRTLWLASSEKQAGAGEGSYLASVSDKSTTPIVEVVELGEVMG
jgi:hypothetical protein